jgi:hypothetical protein
MPKAFREYLEESIKSRIMSKITKTGDGHWIYKGHHGTDGYAQIGKNGSAVNAHRELYKLIKGPLDPGTVLLHKKGCPRTCCNPAHLTPGTKKENNQQTVKDGRHRNQNTASRTAPGTPKDTGERD